MLTVRKIIFIPLIFSILAVLSGCNSSDEQVEVVSTPNDLTLFQSAKTKWDSQSGQFYTIQSQRFCECVAEMSAQMKISVSENLILSAFDVVSDAVISNQVREEIYTVDGLFALIEKAIADGTSIEVTYNEEFGYPETVKIDLEKLAVDGGLHVHLSDLEIKNSLLALDNVTWALKSFGSIAGPQPIIENTNISLSIDMHNMQLSGFGGCNSYLADFVLESKGTNMIISNIAITSLFCNEPENIMQQERSYIATLLQIQSFTFDNATLNLQAGTDSGLYFETAELATIRLD